MFKTMSENLKQEARGIIRKQIQWNFHNGSSVIWGSEDKLSPEVTVKKLEEFCMTVCENFFNEVNKA